MAYARIRPRRGTASQWNTANPILAEGEIGIEVPSTGVGKGLSKIKIGDGVTAWKSLPYAINVSVVQNLDTASTTNVPSVTAVKTAIDEAMGGCWIDFTDAEGNATDEPYIHWYAEEE